jgi:hypothetical protein
LSRSRRKPEIKKNNITGAGKNARIRGRMTRTNKGGIRGIKRQRKWKN